MKNYLAILVLFALVFSCASQPSGGGSGEGGSTSSSGIVISQTDGAETIESLPDLKLKLKDMPDSLSDPSLKLKSIRLKNIGDISTLTPSTLPDVKSSAWHELIMNIQRESAAQAFIQSLKQAAAYGLQIPVGQTNTLDENTKVYCKSDGNGGLEFYFRMLESGEIDTKIDTKLYIHVYPVNDKSAVEFIMEQQLSGFSSYFAKVFSYYNEYTKEMIDSSFFNDGATENIFYWKTYWDSPSSVSIVSTYYNGNDTAFSLGWGDNNYGGVINNMTSPDINNIYVEYYNNNGGLVYKAFGSIYNEMDFSFFDASGTNIYSYFTSKPENINVIFEYWHDGSSYGSKTYISNSGTITKIADHTDYRYFYYKVNPSWQSGDCIYFNESYDGDTNFELNGTNINRYYYTYKKALEVPSQQTYLGTEYYFQNYWPLKYLSLENQYSTYTITRKVIDESSYTNIYYNFDMQEVTNIYTWQDFDWWLDKNNNSTFDTNYDIDLNGILQEEDVYLWNDSLSDFVQSKAIMSFGTGDNPLYFIFNGTNIVSSVKTKIENIYNTYKETNFADLITNKTIPNPELFPEILK